MESKITRLKEGTFHELIGSTVKEVVDKLTGHPRLQVKEPDEKMPEQFRARAARLRVL